MGPVIDQVMGQMDLPALVENVMSELDLGPIVQQVLTNLDLSSIVNEVLGDMEMSSVVMQATGGMTTEVLGEVRNRSADGDALVERIVAKVLRRRLAELPPPSSPRDESNHDAAPTRTSRAPGCSCRISLPTSTSCRVDGPGS